jgi:predicted AlkP superfamily pyrophosphatase or phosphodiesterase
MPAETATLGSITRLAPTVAGALGLARPGAARDAPVEGLAQRMEGASRVLILVLDSWGELNWQRHRARTPWLDRADKSVRVGTLEACQPSTTPVNFAAIGTGAPAEVHKVLSRDHAPQVETLFMRARAEAKGSTVIGPVAATATNVLGPGAALCLKASTKADSNAEVALMTAIHLAEARPELCLVQALDLDTVGHIYGPHTPEHIQTMEETDRLLARLVPAASSLGYWTLITADHGMHTDPDPHAHEKGTHGSTMPEDAIVPLWALPPSG